MKLPAMNPEPEAEVSAFTPSDPVSQRWVNRSRRELAAKGVEVALGRNVFKDRQHFTAGTLSEREEDMRWAIAAARINWVTGGGFSAIDLMPALVSLLPQITDQDNRIWGYSNTDWFTNLLFARNLKSVYGPHLGWYFGWNEVSKRAMVNYIKGDPMPSFNHGARWTTMVPGEARGRLLVSGLDTLRATSGTDADPLNEGDDDVVLFLEDNDVEKSDFRHDLMELVRQKKIGRVKGVVVGRTPGMKEKGYKTWSRRISRMALVQGILGTLKVPLATYGDFGHAPENAREPRFTPMLKGAEVKLTVNGRKSGLIYTGNAR